MGIQLQHCLGGHPIKLLPNKLQLLLQLGHNLLPLHNSHPYMILPLLGNTGRDGPHNLRNEKLQQLLPQRSLINLM
jgi:hypothetical protein